MGEGQGGTTSIFCVVYLVSSLPACSLYFDFDKCSPLDLFSSNVHNAKIQDKEGTAEEKMSWSRRNV